MAKLTLTAEYDSEETARSVAEALNPDNGDYVRTDVNGKTVTFFMEAASAASLRNTADDLLACLKIAEEASGIVGTASDFDGDALSE
ncbi:MAG: KEOPS complex subunit Pcc1 [Candidatus Methanomethylophilaceae archaeon]|jgi:tRNA threonylcarbamoyladenosine modification (KEOPS) complex  Pcc1 subunit